MESNNLPPVVEKILAYDESLYDLMCSLISFNFKAENESFNKFFLNECLTQGETLEIIYNSNNEKMGLILYMIIETLLIFAADSSQENAELLYLDSTLCFNILNVFQILEKRVSSSQELMGDSDKKSLIKSLLARIKLMRAYDRKEFFLLLKATPFFLSSNHKIKIVFIDSINAFQLFEEKLPSFDAASEKKNKKRNSIGKKAPNLSRDCAFKMHEYLLDINRASNAVKVFFKREPFKMKDSILYNENEGTVYIQKRLFANLTNRNLNTAKIAILNQELISDYTFDFINTLLIKQKAEPAQRAPNLCFCVKLFENEAIGVQIVDLTNGYYRFHGQVIINNYQVK